MTDNEEKGNEIGVRMVEAFRKEGNLRVALQTLNLRQIGFLKVKVRKMKKNMERMRFQKETLKS